MGAPQTAESLLKAIDEYLDEEILSKAKKHEDDEEEETAKAHKKAAAEDEEEEETVKAKKHEDDEEESEEEMTAKKAKKKMHKGEAEGGHDEFKPGKAGPDKYKSATAKKSFETDAEFAEYQQLKKAHQDSELAKVHAEKETLMKSLTGLSDQLSELRSKMDGMAKEPAAAPKSVDGLKVLEKGNASAHAAGDVLSKAKTVGEQKMLKAKIANLMFVKGVREGKLAPEDVSEYESTMTLLDATKRDLVKSLVATAMEQGEF